MIKDYLTRAVGRTGAFLRGHRAEIAFGIGVIGYGASIYFTYRSTEDLKRAARLYSRNKIQLKAELEKGTIGEEQYDYELRDERIRTTKDIAKGVTPILLSTAVGIGGFAVSYKIQKDTISGLALALTSVTNALAASNPDGKVITDEEGKPIEMPFQVVYDRRSSNFSIDPTDNILNLKAAQKLLNIRVISNGVLYLNEVMDTLGLPRVPCGFEYGWIYDKEHSDQVDFGIFDSDMCLIDKSNLSDAAVTNGVVLRFNNLRLINHKLEETAYKDAMENRPKIEARNRRRSQRALERYIKEHEKDFDPYTDFKDDILEESPFED